MLLLPTVLKLKEACIAMTILIKSSIGNGLGGHLYSVFRPLSPQFAVTGFYQKSLLQKFHTKLTYTVNNYSFNTIGVGFSTQIEKLNIYGVIDNVLKFNNIPKANNISAQLEFNVIF
jgi:hypothetical protein